MSKNDICNIGIANTLEVEQKAHPSYLIVFFLNYFTFLGHNIWNYSWNDQKLVNYSTNKKSEEERGPEEEKNFHDEHNFKNIF